MTGLHGTSLRGPARSALPLKAPPPCLECYRERRAGLGRTIICRADLKDTVRHWHRMRPSSLGFPFPVTAPTAAASTTALVATSQCTSRRTSQRTQPQIHQLPHLLDGCTTLLRCAVIPYPAGGSYEPKVIDRFRALGTAAGVSSAGTFSRGRRCL